jgi:hypothetical protein
LPSDITGVNLKRKHIFMNKWIRHGGRYPLVLLRIWRQGMARVEDRMMDEHVVLSEGRAVTFDGGFSDHNLNDLSFFIDKHNGYATREAIEILNQRYGFLDARSVLTAQAASRQTATKRFAKEKVFNRVPFPWGAIGYFGYRYVVRLGFLDGVPGLIYHFLQGFWYRFLVGAKVVEFEQALQGRSDPAVIRAELSRLTGISLTASRRHNELETQSP